jgi:hypothetical protein
LDRILMAGKSTVWTDPRWEDWVRKFGPVLGWTSQAFLAAFRAEFGPNTPAENGVAFQFFAKRIRDGGHVMPTSGQRDLTQEVLNVKCRSALVCSDWHIDYHDAEWARFAFEIGQAFGCDELIIPGDFLDVAMFAKFDPELHGVVPLLENELGTAEAILAEGVKRFSHVSLALGNHEWRLWRRVLQSSILPDRFLRLMTVGDNVTLTEFSYINLDAGGHLVRCTHPKNYSQVSGRVGARLAEKYHAEFIVAHDHRLAQIRDASGKFTVTHIGMMADPARLPYINSVDSVNPQMGRGFAVVTPGQTYLFDHGNTDRDHWLHLAKKGALRWTPPTGSQPQPSSSARSAGSSSKASARKSRTSGASAATA